MITFKELINEGFKRDQELLTRLRKEFWAPYAKRTGETFAIKNIKDGVEVINATEEFEDALFNFMEDNDIEASVSTLNKGKMTIKTYDNVSESLNMDKISKQISKIDGVKKATVNHDDLIDITLDKDGMTDEIGDELKKVGFFIKHAYNKFSGDSFEIAPRVDAKKYGVTLSEAKVELDKKKIISLVKRVVPSYTDIKFKKSSAYKNGIIINVYGNMNPQFEVEARDLDRILHQEIGTSMHKEKGVIGVKFYDTHAYYLIENLK